MKNHYDIAVLGGGLAGLSLLYHLERAGKLSGKSVVLIDPEGRKSAHDRSWSFWEEGAGPFEELVYHTWPGVSVHNERRSLDLPLGDFNYKLIRSTEFYAYVNQVIDGNPNVERVTARAEEVVTDGNKVSFRVDGNTATADLAFSSLPLHLRPRQIAQPYLDQHFRGWFITTEEDTFDPNRAALMDFRIEQHGETRFCYVLPFSKRRAMVEVAIFSNNHLQQEEYDQILETYIYDHWTQAGYTIDHTEAGNIPMTTYPFPTRDRNLIYIGMRGGATRPSTGYTFYGLQRQLLALAQNFPALDNIAPWSRRHLLYDDTLLRILAENKLAGAELFVDLFARNPPGRVLAFLNGETSIFQELQLMSTTNIGVFGRSFVSAVSG